MTSSPNFLGSPRQESGADIGGFSFPGGILEPTPSGLTLAPLPLESAPKEATQEPPSNKKRRASELREDTDGRRVRQAVANVVQAIDLSHSSLGGAISSSSSSSSAAVARPRVNARRVTFTDIPLPTAEEKKLIAVKELMRTYINYGNGAYEKALEVLDRLNVGSEDSELSILRVLCLYQLDRDEEMREILLRMIRVDPDFPESHFWMGCLHRAEAIQLYKRGSLEASRSAFQNALQKFEDYLGIQERILGVRVEDPRVLDFQREIYRYFGDEARAASAAERIREFE